MAASMRSVVRAAYQGRFAGSRETGDVPRLASGCVSSRLASARNTSRPMTRTAASRSQRFRMRARCRTETVETPTRCSGMARYAGVGRQIGEPTAAGPYTLTTSSPS